MIGAEMFTFACVSERASERGIDAPRQGLTRRASPAQPKPGEPNAGMGGGGMDGGRGAGALGALGASCGARCGTLRGLDLS